MRILVTGAAGQVGREIGKLDKQDGLEMILADAAQLNIGDRDAVSAFFQHNRVDAVINAAAWTSVDKAESQQLAVYKSNRDGPKHLADVCSTADIPLLHFSTDYVFDGKKKTPYSETDSPCPINVYGASKLAGEDLVSANCAKHFIVRTSWVFSAHRQNFVTSMLSKAAEKQSVSVVADQHGKPTSASVLATLSIKILADRRTEWGIYHVAQPDEVSWHGFANAIFAEAIKQKMKLRTSAAIAITTSDYPTAAVRPANSVLDCRKFEERFGIRIPHWRDSLVTVINEIRNCGIRA